MIGVRILPCLGKDCQIHRLASISRVKSSEEIYVVGEDISDENGLAEEELGGEIGGGQSLLNS
jgi:hypothetical protein